MKLERRTKRLIIRPYRPTDYQSWYNTLSSMLPKQNPWDQTSKHSKDLSKQKFQKILKTQSSNRKKDYYFDFGVFLKDGTLVGGVSLMDLSRGVFQNAYLGYRMYNQFWGKGYGTEAVRAGIDIAFRELKLHRLEAGIEPGNRRSIRLAKALGFRKEGLSKRRLFLREQWVDLYIYVLTTEDAGYSWKGSASLVSGRF